MKVQGHSVLRTTVQATDMAITNHCNYWLIQR